jgi:nicotinate-nucleotide pyrophosphorylase (carboxylating)
VQDAGPHSKTIVDPPAAAVRRAVSRALDEDLLPFGDLTSALVPAGTVARAGFVARTDGVVAGRMCVLETFSQVDSALQLAWHMPDGSVVKAGSLIAEAEGPMGSLLSAERTALNFLCHLSGVATLTHQFVEVAKAQNPNTRILDTRKTTPGLRALEKAAVRAGGGHNHRGSLSEAILVKDNHLVGIGIAEAVFTARATWPGRFVEVECDRVEQVAEAVEAGTSAVLLDNMSPKEVAEAVSVVRRRSAPGSVLVEVSGRVTVDRVAEYASAGADLISVGALTHSAPVLDIGLDLSKVTTAPESRGG